MGVGWRWFSVVLGLSVALFGCPEDPGPSTARDDGCRSCHGSNRGPAPPKALDGSEDPKHPGVGAHEAHLFGTRLMRPVSCTECHVRPDDVDDPGHLDETPGAELVFGALASSGGVTSEWNREALTCSTYCHGVTMEGGAHQAPVWNLVDGTQVECASCHAMPPPAPHPANDDCQLCHAPVAGPGQTIATPQRHIDGTLDVRDAEACAGCHGSKDNLAPPHDLAMESATTKLTVGAHQSHLFGGYFSRPVECAACHVVPLALEDPGHVDDEANAEVTFGELANRDGASPAWDRDAGACANTYCHGATLEGPDPTPPRWTVVDGTEAKCGGCHAIPPPAPHPANDRCEMCHLPTAGPKQTVANRSTHIDGVLDVTIDGCTGCHGTEENLAPPIDTSQNAATTIRSVGAHQTHLSGGQHSAPVACDTCHLVPTEVDDPGHLDSDLPAEVMMSGMARAGGAQPSWLEDSATCANTYCHGANSSGGTNVDPTWTVVDGSQTGCGSCHGLPPSAPHPDSDRCMLCHSPTAGPDQTIANRATHIDGIVQASDGTCTDCHGGGDNPAPPMDTMMQSDPALPSIGAHRSHLESATGISRPVACTECHVVPVETDDPGHIDTGLPAELTWGPLAAHDGVAPTFDRTTATCSNTYCHGATLPDGVLTEPRWNVLDGSQAACGTCHGNPPAGSHPNDDRCELCHLPTAGPAMTIASAATHIDGVLQVAADCDSCHGENGVSAPPLDLDGASATNLPTVGAHRTHLSGGATGKPVECAQCHVVPAEVGSPGHIDTIRPAEINFGSIAAFGTTPIYTRATCADTHCHSGVSGTVPNPDWTILDGSQGECGSCHGLPPDTPSHQNLASDCSTCHLPTAGPNQTIANRATHVDGVLQVTGLDCTSCHGDMTSSAPPLDLGGGVDTTDPEVGAHRAHLNGGAFSAPVPCATCHVVPADTNDPGHLDTPAPAEVTFSGRAAASLATPSFDGNTRRCSDTYCHGAISSLGTNTDPIWNQPGTADCGSCHGIPPAAPHPQVDDCQVCHSPVAGPGQSIADATRHVDGVVDVDDQQPCEACHGTPGSPAPPMDLMGLMTSAQVGAHQAHLAGTGTSRAVPCSECHLTVDPATPNQAGHYDSARPAELTFGVLARTGGLNPTKNGSTCSNTYCHGETLLGGNATSPSWTDGAQACSACHGMPPPDSNHGNGTATDCESCHPDTAGPNQTIVDASKHVNGAIDTSAACDACHGQNGDPMPPLDLAGLSVSDQVGAHQAHRNPTNSTPVACTSCHLVPLAYGDPGHADTPTPAEVTLVGRAALAGLSPSYDGGQLRCTNTYCHGATLAGGTTQVLWNDGDGSESQCGACHGMPPNTPAHSGQSPNGCQNCHQDDAGPNQTITDPSLHLDGVVQVSGGGCDTCHGSPPDPTRESYPGSAGAHAQHAGVLGFECATCHGNNGTGPDHDQGNGTVIRSNVDIVFSPSITYPGGTTMGNASYDSNGMTCGVGCHNPVIGNPPESPNLGNTLSWTGNAPGCRGCHDKVQASLPRGHDILGLGDAGCLACHDQTNHTGGTTAILDPDPSDGFSWSPNNLDGLCKTCHDGGGGQFFGGQTAQDVSPFWTTSSHGAEGYDCSTCHTYHASSGGPLFLDASNASCMASGCHANLASDFNQVSGGPVSHHRIEGGPGIQLSCINCHNPHLSQAVPLSAVDPDDKWSLYNLPATRQTRRHRDGDYRPFCLRCHDGSPPPGVQGALNIASALQGGSEPSQFKKENESLHRKEHNKYNCQNCHLDHGSSGTNGINRGRLLMNYMTVNQFPYRGEGSCGTNPNGNFSCHD